MEFGRQEPADREETDEGEVEMDEDKEEPLDDRQTEESDRGFIGGSEDEVKVVVIEIDDRILGG